MNPQTVVGIIVGFLSLVLGIWGASLVVRALASRGSRFSLRWRRRVPRPLHITPPKLSRVQFWFGMIAGPVFVAAGGALAIVVLQDVLLSRDENPLFAIGALLLMMLGAGTLLVGYRWDPAEGRRRCTKCWYHYSGLRDDAACPECGRVPRNGRALIRTRRSGAMMRLGCALIAGALVVYVTPRAMETDGRSLVPTTVLIAGFERLPDRLIVASGWTNDATLQRRLWEGDLTNWQRAWLISRSTRLLETSDDPRVCGLAGTFLSGPNTWYHGAGLDEAYASMLRVMLADKAGLDVEPGFEAAGILSTGPKSAMVVAENIDVLLARYKSPTSAKARLAYGRLLVRLAPTNAEVLRVVAEVAHDPALAYVDHAVACIVYGMIAGKDPSAVAQLERDFESAAGFDREVIAAAIIASGVESRSIAPTGAWIDTTADQTKLLLEGLASEDAAVRNGAMANASAGYVVHGVGCHTEKVEEAVRAIARGFPESRVRAIQYLAVRHSLDVEVIEPMCAIVREGTPEDLAALAAAVSGTWMNQPWIPLYDALTERTQDPALDAATIALLDQIRGQMQRSIPSLR